MKQLTIKTFMIDSKRPTWLIELLFYVRSWFPFKEINEMACEDCFSWLERAIDETPYVKRNARYKLSECTRTEINGNKLTIYTLYKDNPMIEFEIVEEGGQQ